jgi:heparanase
MTSSARCVPFLIALAIAFTLPAAAQDATVSLQPGKMPALGKVDERFQSYNVEMIEITGGRFWAPYKQADKAPADTAQPTPGGMPASLYRYRAPIDLSNPKLRKLAAALGPAYIRVSGTWVNSTFFQDSDDPVPTNAGAPTDSPSSAKAPDGFNGILTRAQWRGVIDFAHAVDAQLVTSFAVSQGVRDANGVWTPVEAEKVLRYTHSIGGSIAAAEMFNEPTFASMGGAPKGYDAAAYARDFQAFHSYIKKAAPDLIVLGPGGIGESGVLGQMPGIKLIRSEDMLQQQGPGLLDAFSYHFYGGISQRCAGMGVGGTTTDAALTHDWLTRTDRDEAFYAALRDRLAPGKPIWLTETGETACGGDPWASDFIDSFRYLYQLGSLAKRGVQVIMHNTLNASDYALIDESTLQPRPNYWAAVLWRRLMGTTVLDAGNSPTANLYVFAHCLRDKPGGVALLAINADKTQAHDLALAAKSTRYTLASSDLLSPIVQLNGVELAVSVNGDLPALNGSNQKSSHVSLAPASITFMALPGAHNSACR